MNIYYYENNSEKESYLKSTLANIWEQWIGKDAA